MGKENKKHEAYFKKILSKTIKNIQKEILDNTQCAVEGKDRWNAVRSRILGATNSAKRELETEIERNWILTYNPDTIYEDIVEIKGPDKEKEKLPNGSKKT